MYKKAVYEYDDNNQLVNSGKCAVYDDDGNFVRYETFDGEVYTGGFRTPKKVEVDDREQQMCGQAVDRGFGAGGIL